MTQKSSIILLALMLFSFFDNIAGQSNINGYSISPKVGLYSAFEKDQVGFIVGGEGNIMKNNFLYSASYYYGDELIIIGADPDRYFTQATLLFGRYRNFHSIRMEYQAGIAAIWGIRYAEYHSQGFLNG